MATLLEKSSRASVRVRVPTPRTGGPCSTTSTAGARQERPRRRSGDLAHRLGIPLHELRSVTASLEEAYGELTKRSVEYATPPAHAVRHRLRRPPRGPLDDPHRRRDAPRPAPDRHVGPGQRARTRVRPRISEATSMYRPCGAALTASSATSGAAVSDASLPCGTSPASNWCSKSRWARYAPGWVELNRGRNSTDLLQRPLGRNGLGAATARLPVGADRKLRSGHATRPHGQSARPGRTEGHGR